MLKDSKIPEQSSDWRVPDAKDKNWVDGFCPLWSHPYLRLSRVDRPIGTWLLLLPCWWGLLLAVWSHGQASFITAYQIFAACAFGAFLMRGAGCTWNDLIDRKLDAQVERTKLRPLASGQVTVFAALFWMGVQLLAALLILMSFNKTAVALGLGALIPVMIYPFAKRFTWWPQIFLGIAFNWGALFGWVAYTGTLSWTAVFLYFGGIFWTLFYDTIYALQDKVDDARIGIKSTARLFTVRARQWLYGFMIAALLTFLITVLSAFSMVIVPASLLCVIGGFWGFGCHLAWQLLRLDIDSPQNCLAVFRSNFIAGLLVVMGLFLGIILQIIWA